jgi:hypothetical protein
MHDFRQDEDYNYFGTYRTTLHWDWSIPPTLTVDGSYCPFPHFSNFTPIVTNEVIDAASAIAGFLNTL